MQLQPVEVRGPHDLDRAFATIKEARPDGLIVVPDRFLLTYRASIVQFMAEHRLPGMFPFREFVQEGGLLAYGPDYTDMYRRAATYVVKILKGAKPADLPMEQPTKFELVINLKTAQALPPGHDVHGYCLSWSCCLADDVPHSKIPKASAPDNS